MSEETQNTENTKDSQLKDVFKKIHDLDLNSKAEGLIAIGYSKEDGDHTALRVTIQGNRSNLVQALAASMDTDDDLREIFQKAMMYSIAKRLGQD